MKYFENDTRIIKEYMVINDEILVYINNFFEIPFKMRSKNRNIIYLTDNRFIRKFLRICKRRAEYAHEILNKGKQFEALLATISNLNRNNIPCYIFLNPQKKSYDYYDEKALYRIKNGLNFPMMAQNPRKYEPEFKILIGEKYSLEYIKKLTQIPQIIKRGSIYGHEDCNTELVNVIAGKRITIGNSNKAQYKIHMYGRCGVFGYAVEDKDTIPSKLQKKLLDNGYEEFNVVNHGLWGAEESYIFHNIILDAKTFKEGDLLIIYMNPFPENRKRLLEAAGAYYFDCTEKFHMAQESKWCFYDFPAHMAKDGYEVISEIIGQFLIQNNFEVKSSKIKNKFKIDKLQEYLQEVERNDFAKNLKIYLKEIKELYLKEDKLDKNGAIIMNCNPFTNGHRYLIEYATKKVDKLFVFVLEEDKSYFRFRDRFDLVKKGTSDLKNVIILPSKEFMISAYTFPEYFMKDYVKTREIDVTKDLIIFSEKIAPALNIKIRFAGEEPIDHVTAIYNNNMKSILPQYGIEFCEIPRLKIDGEGVVSASKVRKFLEEKNWKVLRQYVPETTFEYLYKTYGENSESIYKKSEKLSDKKEKKMGFN